MRGQGGERARGGQFRKKAGKGVLGSGAGGDWGTEDTRWSEAHRQGWLSSVPA